MQCYKKSLFSFLFVFSLAFCMINLKSTCNAANNLVNKHITMTNSDIEDAFEVIQQRYGQMKTPANVSYDTFMTNLLQKQFIGYWLVQSSGHDYYDTRITGGTKRNDIYQPTTNNIVTNDTYQRYRNDPVGYNIGTSNLGNRITWWSTGEPFYFLFIDDNRNLWEYSSDNFSVVDVLFPPLAFVYYDDSHTAQMPNGDSATCVFINPLVDYQNIGYISDFDSHPNIQVTIFAQNYRDPDNVLVNSIGEDNFYIDSEGRLFVDTNTMWTALVYEIVGIDGADSFISHYYIAAGSNSSGDPLFNGYDADYNNNQFFLWKLLGSFGDDSGDKGSGIFGRSI